MDEAKTDDVGEAKTFVLMRVKTGSTEDSHHFTYRAGFFGEVSRIEWPSDTMIVDVPTPQADYLIRNNYARRATDEEVEAYTAPAVEQKEEPAPPPKPRKEKHA